jgi:hypothetical protein
MMCKVVPALLFAFLVGGISINLADSFKGDEVRGEKTTRTKLLTKVFSAVFHLSWTNVIICIFGSLLEGD